MERRIGTAGWTVPPQYADLFPAEGSHLARYAAVFDTVEINSSFYRPHRRQTYERWAETVPEHFRFSVKCPRTITHERRLQDTDALIAPFLDGVRGLGSKLGPLLIQFPPGLLFERESAFRFFETLRAQFEGALVCEPRHPGWFGDEAERLLNRLHVARVLADPPVNPDRPVMTGWPGLFYARLHGAPEMYVSAYDDPVIVDMATKMAGANAPAWCVFDNTARGAASNDARRLRGALALQDQK